MGNVVHIATLQFNKGMQKGIIETHAEIHVEWHNLLTSLPAITESQYRILKVDRKNDFSQR